MEPNEPGRVELKFTKDSRVLAGVSGAVNHMAESSGMDEPGRAELVAALEDALHAAFVGQAAEDSHVEMTIATAGGRIEAVMTFRGGSPEGSKAENIQKVLRGRLDSVTLDVSGDTSRLRLVKNLPVKGKKR